MKPPDIVHDEIRLAALDELGILDTAPEQGFDDVVQLATQVCDVPVALVSLVANDRQWFKAKVGFEPCETDLGSSVCTHALAEPDLLVIPDLTRDPRTAANPIVTGEPRIRFYAGAPLRTKAGHVVGSLCVIDTKPRPGGLTDRQADILRNLARQVTIQFELRRALAEQRSFEERIRRSEAHWRGLFERLSEGFLVGEVVRDAAGRITAWRCVDVNAAGREFLGIDPAALLGRAIGEVGPEAEPSWVEDVARVVGTGEPASFTRQVRARWYEGRAFALGGERFGLILLEVTERLLTEGRRAALLTLGDRLRDLATVPEVTQAASEIVGRTLGASRAAYGRFVDRGEVIEVEADWTREGEASIAGRHRLADYGDLVTGLHAGLPLVIEDVLTDPRTSADPEPLRALGIRSLVNMPVRMRGQTVAILVVHDGEPRIWSAEALAFLRNVADRVEAAVARLRAEDDQRVLNQELSHRMKNTLAMVQAIAAQTLKGVAERDAVEAFKQRVHALAAAHDVLLQQSWAAARIGGVVEAVLANFGQAEHVDASGPDLDLGPRATLSLSLLLHELATNALKYGSLSAEAGRVRIAWRIEGEEVRLGWREVGGPPPSTPGRTGFGSRLIRLGLVGTGGADLRYLPTGFEADFTASLDEVQQS